MEMSPAIALSSSVDDILNAPSIQMVALLCIFPRIFMGYERGLCCRTIIGTYIVL